MGLEDTSRPLGVPVDPAPARRPDAKRFEGRFVTLVPLQASHADDLFAVAGGGTNAALWDYMPDGPFPEPAAFRDHIARKAQSQDPLFYAILENASGKPVGHATLMRIDTAHRVIETGNILYSPRLQQTPGATECMYLLARHVFEDGGYRRYEWKCNALNAPSRRAAARLGFTFEGEFRQHMIVKGRNRDTAWFSMLDTEWPAVKQAFEAWLAPENFDAAGRQRAGLASFRASA